jgi:hypothetical protein
MKTVGMKENEMGNVMVSYVASLSQAVFSHWMTRLLESFTRPFKSSTANSENSDDKPPFISFIAPIRVCEVVDSVSVPISV